jgi:nitrate reductase NapAB chaperone NapD
VAITGFLVHCEAEQSGRIERRLAELREITSFGVHRERYIVAVAEAPGGEMEELLRRVRGVEGVLSLYVTSMTIEDEIES